MSGVEAATAAGNCIWISWFIIPHISYRGVVYMTRGKDAQKSEGYADKFAWINIKAKHELLKDKFTSWKMKFKYTTKLFQTLVVIHSQLRQISLHFQDIPEDWQRSRAWHFPKGLLSAPGG